MPKRVDVKVKGFEGAVTFFQPLNLEQVLAFEDAQDKAAEDVPPSTLLTKLNEREGVKDAEGEVVRLTWASRADRHFIPALCLCIEKWEIEGLPEKVEPENFPMTPRTATNNLITFLIGELARIYSGEVEVPNES